MPINEPVSGTLTPVTRSRGNFLAGQPVLFYFDFPDLRGMLYDPIDLQLVITDPTSAAVVTETSLDRIEEGEYGYAWTIPADATIGLYSLNLTYTVETIDGPVVNTLVETFTVAKEATGVTNPKFLAQRVYLEEEVLGYAQRIPVFDEPARLNKARTIAKLSFQRWNQPAGVEVKLNGDLIETGYSADYLRGLILFDHPLTEVDEVHVSYNFRWFTDAQLGGFVTEGINLVNLWPVQTTWTYLRIPNEWIIASTHAAAVFALRRLIMDLLFQEPQKVFGGAEQADKILQHLDTLKKNYEEWLEKMLEQKKKGPYVGLTYAIVVPEYTLPGGRSRWFRYLFKG